MSAAPSSPPASPGGHPLPIEALRAQLGGLLSQREALRSAGATRAELESNRREIGRVQHELARALVSRHAR